MDTQTARKKADFIAHTQIGSDVFKKLGYALMNREVTKYYEGDNSGDAVACRVIHHSDGVPGEVNFYLERANK